jgi:hypothetical protein
LASKLSQLCSYQESYQYAQREEFLLVLAAEVSTCLCTKKRCLVERDIEEDKAQEYQDYVVDL